MRTRTSDGIELAVMRALCNHQRSSYSRRVLKALDADPKTIRDLELDVHGYTDSLSFSDDYLLYSFLRKWTGFGVASTELETKTVDGWRAAERQCFSTNERLKQDLLTGNAPLELISRIQRKIEKVLGARVSPEVVTQCRWSGGATFDLRRGALTQDKIRSPLTVTAGALPLLLDVMDEKWAEVCEGPAVVRGNRCVQVPKTASINRMIAAEPTANAFMQQGVGRYIRRRLQLFGVDLNDQTVNQDLALRALVDRFATIDLSSASDTLALNLVELLLPPAWFDYLDSLRSPASFLNGRWYKLEKFSSMGNAYTFELESLIFWAICSSVSDMELPPNVEKCVSVYGDDIIVNQEIERQVVSALQYFGFTVNTDKSYFSGSRFFESCGRHYFDLEDVTPVYQKEVVGRDLFEIMALHNRLFRWFLRNPRHYSTKVLDMIVGFAKSVHPKLKELPRTPPISDDMGFLTQGLRADRNGDYKCFVLQAYTDNVYNIDPKAESALYSYKLRRGSAFLNSTPEGWCGDVSIMRRRLTKTTIWAHMLL